MVKQEHPNKSRFLRFRSFLTFKNVVLIVLVLVALLQYMKIGGLADNIASLENQGAALIKEVGGIKDSGIKMGRDLNEARK
ncbi:MAG: hypothetical protein WC269_03435, partial [Candidatus Gracilibacteria bacterium]